MHWKSLEVGFRQLSIDVKYSVFSMLPMTILWVVEVLI